MHMSTLSPAQLLKQLQWRYATKQFDADRKIPEDVWSALADSLALTPSSFGLQPWHFVVVTDSELKEKLLPVSWGQTQVTECSHFLILAAKTDVDDAEIQRFINRIAEVRNVEADTLTGYRDMMSGFVAKMSDTDRLQWAKHQVYIALGQLMTSAAALGVDACPMEGIDPQKYDEILNLPTQGLTTTVACALGYRSEEDKYATTPKVRFPTEELISYSRNIC